MHMLAKIYPPILTVSDCPDAKIVGCDQVANTAFTDRRVLDGFAHDIELIVTTHASVRIITRFSPVRLYVCSVPCKAAEHSPS